jgi:hypothetical protein
MPPKKRVRLTRPKGYYIRKFKKKVNLTNEQNVCDLNKVQPELNVLNKETFLTGIGLSQFQETFTISRESSKSEINNKNMCLPTESFEVFKAPQQSV